ncbi:MAG: hypothetical protein JXR49_10420 [Acidobacteria bacterium]|nr:hypothetical protein [Acidobacteriota bacterium]
MRQKKTVSQFIANSDAIIFDLFHTLVSLKSDGTAGRNTSEILGIPEAEWNKLLWEFSEDRLRHNDQDDVSIIRKMARRYDPSIQEAKIEDAARERAARFRECTLFSMPTGSSTNGRSMRAVTATGSAIGSSRA